MSTPETPPRAGSDRIASIFRAFAIEGFQDWPAWRRLELILSSNGGSYGLVGPRGAGKTWLMMRAVEEADDSGGIGLWFPSPSEYDPQAFLSALSDNFAAVVERRFRERHRLARTLFELQSPWVALVLACFFFFVYRWVFENFPGVEIPAASDLPYFASAALAIATALATVAYSGSLARSRPEGAVIAQARMLQERIRYSATLTKGTQAAAGGVQGLLSFTRSSQRELLERPTTTSSLVHDFRRLGRDTAKVIGTSRVVIALDELDKMVEPDKVRALLRDIKGIFEIEGVHFLVSVSHEAARVLKLGGLAERNEFNSSFYTVVELQPLAPDECRKLMKVREELGRRDRLQWLDKRLATKKHAGDAAMEGERERLRAVARTREPTKEQLGRWVAIGVLAGGNPRETIRLADVADERRDGADPDPARAAIAAILRAELLEFRREAVASSLDSEGRTRLSDEELKLMHHAVDKLVSEDDSLLTAASTAIADLWTPTWAGYAWRTLLGEEWQRLVIRLQVGGEMIRRGELADDELKRLAEVVAEASLSASAAKLRLDGES